MLYYENSSLDPLYNHAWEEVLFHMDTTEDIFLVWRNGPCVVCGSYQNPYAEVSIPDAADMGLPVLRRPSGGGTVYHDRGNINYTWIKTLPSRTVEYEQFTGPVAEVLQSMGIPAYLTPICDISLEGKKISGSAQKMIGHRVLHHGTLLYDCDLAVLRQVANGKHSGFVMKGTDSVPKPVRNIREYLESRAREEAPVTAISDVVIPDAAIPDADAFLEAFRDTFLQKAGEKTGEGETIRKGVLTPEQEEEIRELIRTKYSDWTWNFGKTPPFSYEKTFEYDKRNIKVTYQAKKAVIQTISWEISEPDSETEPEAEAMAKALTDALTGRFLVPEELQSICREITGDADFYRHLL